MFSSQPVDKRSSGHFTSRKAMSNLLFTKTQANAGRRGKQGTSGVELVKLNVGGTVFLTTQNTLQTLPGTLLATLTKESPWYNTELDAFYFDRDPGLFSHILNVYRWGELHVPTHVCPLGFKKELQFWGIPSSLLLPCCWRVYYSGDRETVVMEKLQEATSSMVHGSSVQDSSHPVKGQSWRIRLWNFLDDPYSSRGAKVWFFLYISVVLLSAIVYLCWMDPGLRVSPFLRLHNAQHNHTNTKVEAMAMTDPHPSLFILDNLCMLLFTFELILRFAVCPNKLKFFKSWLNSLSIVLVIVMIVSFVFEMRKDLIHDTRMGVLFYVLKNLNVLRLLLLVRLQSNFIGLKVLFLSIINSAWELLLMAVSFLIVVLIYGGLVFCAEIHTNAFPDIWTALWWAVVTMTTVGYGDVVPTDIVGRIIGSFCAITGVLIIALPLALIASNFTEYYSRKDYHILHELAKKHSLSSSKSETSGEETFNDVKH